MSKCDNCAIMAEIMASNEWCACAWYIDNVVVGDKSVEDCEMFKESEDKE